MVQKHNWDSTRTSCLKCGMLYRRFRMLLQDMDSAEAYHDKEEIIMLDSMLRCIR